jgi:hypothetical protein
MIGYWRQGVCISCGSKVETGADSNRWCQCTFSSEKPLRIAMDALQARSLNKVRSLLPREPPPRRSGTDVLWSQDSWDSVN